VEAQKNYRTNPFNIS